MPFHDTPPASTQKDHSKRRVALVVGNHSYSGVLPRLSNPGNDAELITSSLRQCHFDVRCHVNLGREALLAAIGEFGTEASGAELALFYFAGHGVHVKGENVLLPIGFQLRTIESKRLRDLDILAGGISLDEVLDATSTARCRLVFLDACRDNPSREASFLDIPPELRSITDSGFEAVQLVEDHRDNTLVAFSADRGQKAADGQGRNSPYTAALAALLTQPLPLQVILTDVRKQVLDATERKQRPREDNTLTENIVLGSSEVEPQIKPDEPPAPPPPEWPGLVAVSSMIALIGILAVKPELMQPIVTGGLQLAKAIVGASCSGHIVEIVGAGRQCLALDDPKTREFQDCSSTSTARFCGPQMVAIPHPPSLSHKAGGTPSRLMAIAKFEATFDDWDACRDDGGCRHNPKEDGWGREKQPVINVSWHQITTEYLPWLNTKLGLSGARVYRLPTPEEWQFAARAGRQVKYPTNDLTALDANFDATNLPGNTTVKRPLRVGTFADRGNHPWGIMDLAGNVAEWVEGCWANSADAVPSNVTTNGTCLREHRGGSWRDRSAKLAISELSRNGGEGSDSVGFRLVRTLD